MMSHYIIPSDNWEQQRRVPLISLSLIISYQAITGNNNCHTEKVDESKIISYQAITGNNNLFPSESL